MITITDQHIQEAEALLIDGRRFDENERIPFIKKLESCDLLAVPGSGKTTALLAKLYCLSKHLPLCNGSGILVLSHTNAAVNEIDKNLRKHCPKLFEYPNFVGTVQSFVNKFLANPACYQKYGTYLLTVDNDIANERIISQTKKLPFGHKLTGYFFNQAFNQHASITKKILIENYGYDDNGAKQLIKQLKDNKTIKNGSIKYLNSKAIADLPIDKKAKETFNDISSRATRKAEIESKTLGIRFKVDFLCDQFIYSDKTLNFNSDSGRSLLNIFENNFTQGIVRYKDCYSLTSWYLHKYNIIKSLLRHRFKYVFIDEMQDLEDYQIKIIDEAFHTDNSQTIIQRIGDVNQAIYNSDKKVKTKADWPVREPILYLKDSMRLTREVADVVNYFTLDRQRNENGGPRFVVNGQRALVPAIKPHLIVFDNDSKVNLTSKFKELIRTFNLPHTPEGHKYGYKIIGWNAQWNDDDEHNGKLRLEDLFEGYKKEQTSKKETYDTLSKYLQYWDRNKTTTRATQDAILRALIHVLRLEGKNCIGKVRGQDVDRYFTISELIKHIQDGINDSDYELFKKYMYEWSFSLSVKKNPQPVYEAIKAFLMDKFKIWFGLQITTATNIFIGREFEPLIIQEENASDNEIANDGINIDIGTVHSVKGQTHCATMYVETSYYEYETQKRFVKEALNKEEHNFDLSNASDIRGKEAFKMMYVGFSRPTHLLCFAALKENVESEIENYRTAGWEIIDITI